MINSRSFNAAYRLPGTIRDMLHNIRYQKTFLQKKLQPVINDSLQSNDGSIDQVDIDKINHYYGLAVPAVLGEAFCRLKGKEMSEQERWTSTCQGAMTGLFDDFFDKDYLADTAIASMISDENLPYKRSNEKLFRFFFINALKHIEEQKIMQDALAEVYNAQVRSKKQKNGSLNTDELLNICYYKGGSSLIFYSTVFFPNATAKELKAFYDLGALMQLANDIFDVFKDRETGIQTIVTDANHIADVRKILQEHLLVAYENCFELHYSKRQVQQFLDVLTLGIFSRSFVCLHQLEKNERLTGNKFVVEKYSRKQLICDMDKKTNMIRSAKSFVLDF